MKVLYKSFKKTKITIYRPFVCKISALQKQMLCRERHLESLNIIAQLNEIINIFFAFLQYFFNIFQKAPYFVRVSLAFADFWVFAQPNLSIYTL